MTKRIVATLLLSLMMLAIFTGCADKKAPETPTTPPEEVPPTEEGSGAEEFTNYEWVILSSTPDCLYYEKDTTFGDMFLNRLDELRKKRNCEIRLDFNLTSTALTQSIIANVAADQYVAEVVSSPANNGNMALAVAKALYPLTELKDYIDYEDTAKYGQLGYLEHAMVDGVPYAVVPNTWPGISSSQHAILCVNLDMISKYNVTTPNELRESGNWNWDRFLEVCTEYAFTDGDRTVVALDTHPYNFMNAVYQGNNVPVVFKDDTGKYVNGFVSGQAAVEAYDFLIKVNNDYANCFKFDTTRWHSYTELENEDTFMSLERPSTFIQLCKIVDNFTLIDFPTGPSLKEGTYGISNYTSISSVGVTSNADLPEYSAQMLADLFEPFEGFETGESMIDYLTETMFFDRKDAELYYDLSMNAPVEYSYYFEGTRSFYENLFKGVTEGTSADIFQKYGNAIDSIIEDVIVPNRVNFYEKH